VNVLGIIKRGGLGLEHVLYIFCILYSVLEVHCFVLIAVDAHGEDIQVGVFGPDAGVELNGLHIALGCVAPVKGGNAYLTFSGYGVDFFAVLEEVSLGLVGYRDCIGPAFY